ncbi:btb (poz) domain-containing 2a-related [Anaeramoeba flamelloides]|uniref:Btb (Poz) domain-containing 2a-related n=1 Tax=Anaeramoeba flamelloides TaxID=1746091 RepID=A0ABQ8YH43_9EUKA|nr:btb (poz) domain-containing 2a-related [Anaeramoeba flamelloides]
MNDVVPLTKTLSHQVNNPQFADVKFLVGKDREPIYGHRIILSLCSPMFRTMFYSVEWKETSDPQLAEVDIPDLDPPSFLALLKFVYTKKLTLNDKIVWFVLYGADKYRIPELVSACLQFLVDSFTVSKSLTILDRSLGLAPLTFQKKLLRMITEKSHRIFKVPNCLSTIKQCTCVAVLRRKNLLVPEIELFYRLVERGEVICKSLNLKPTPSRLRKILAKLLPIIKLRLMSVDELNEVKAYGLYKSSRIKQYIAKINLQIKANEGNLKSTIITNKNKKNNTKTNRNNNSLAPNNVVQTHQVHETIPPRARSQKSIENISVLLLGSWNTTEDTKVRINDVLTSIKSGGIKKVEVINLVNQNIIWSQLKKYDVIFIFSLNKFKNPINVGNLLAKFVKDGGGVVISSVFALKNDKSQVEIQGKIVREQLIPIQKASIVFGQQSRLGRILSQNHPVMHNVQRFEGGKYSDRCSSFSVVNGAKKIALWEDGRILVAELRKKSVYGIVVALNFYPVSDKIEGMDGDFWDHKTDGQKIIANAIHYVALN